MTVKLYGTSPESLLQSEEITYKSFNFSAGEIQVRLPDISVYDNIIIESRYPSSADLFEIFLIYSAINEYSNFEGSVTLFLPYLPYSRQDRVCYTGEAFSLRTFAKLLESQAREKDKIVTWDVHSDVAYETFSFPKLVNVTVEPLLKRFVKKGVAFDPETIVVAPDKGAWSRATLAAQAIGVKKVLYAEKERDPNDGSIKEISLIGKDKFTSEKPVLIVDDICDGGRTFIELAKVIREWTSAPISLYVTHGIFSRGYEVFCQEKQLLIDRILTPNLFPGRGFPTASPRGVNAPGCFNSKFLPRVVTLN